MEKKWSNSLDLKAPKDRLLNSVHWPGEIETWRFLGGFLVGPLVSRVGTCSANPFFGGSKRWNEGWKTVYLYFSTKQNLNPYEGISSINSFFNCGISLDRESWEEFCGVERRYYHWKLDLLVGGFFSHPTWKKKMRGCQIGNNFEPQVFVGK